MANKLTWGISVIAQEVTIDNIDEMSEAVRAVLLQLETLSKYSKANFSGKFSYNNEINLEFSVNSPNHSTTNTIVSNVPSTQIKKMKRVRKNTIRDFIIQKLSEHPMSRTALANAIMAAKLTNNGTEGILNYVSVVLNQLKNHGYNIQSPQRGVYYINNSSKTDCRYPIPNSLLGKTKKRNEIIKILFYADDTMSPKQVAKALNTSSGAMRQILRKMVQAGEIKKRMDGEYYVDKNFLNAEKNKKDLNLKQQTSKKEKLIPIVGNHYLEALFRGGSRVFEITEITPEFIHFKIINHSDQNMIGQESKMGFSHFKTRKYYMTAINKQITDNN